MLIAIKDPFAGFIISLIKGEVGDLLLRRKRYGRVRK